MHAAKPLYLNRYGCRSGAACPAVRTTGPDHLQRLDSYYASDAHFKDPFNEVRGVTAIAGIFAHMFDTLQEPRFVVTERLVQDSQAFLAWEFRFRLRRWRPGSEQCIRVPACCALMHKVLSASIAITGMQLKSFTRNCHCLES